MTAVFIRSADWAEGAFLADVPFDQLDTVIPAIKAWGLMDEEDADLTGQFVYEAEKRKAYFEVVVEYSLDEVSA
jgi:hypothetical protein